MRQSVHTREMSTQQRVEINNQEKSVILRLNREGQNVQLLAAGQTLVVVVILSGDINLRLGKITAAKYILSVSQTI